MNPIVTFEMENGKNNKSGIISRNSTKYSKKLYRLSI